MIIREAGSTSSAFLALDLSQKPLRFCFLFCFSLQSAGRFARGDDAGNAELGGYKYDAEEAAGFQRVEAGGKIGSSACVVLRSAAFPRRSASPCLPPSISCPLRLHCHSPPAPFSMPFVPSPRPSYFLPCAVPSETAAAPRGYGSSRGGFGGGRGGARGGAGAGSAGGAGSKGYDDRAVRAAGRKATSGRDRDGGRGGRGGRGGYRGGGVRRGPGGVLTREPSVHIGGALLISFGFGSLQRAEG